VKPDDRLIGTRAEVIICDEIEPQPDVIWPDEIHLGRVVGVTGSAGCGKSEVARYLEGVGFRPVRMSYPLKRMLAAYYETQGLSAKEIERRIEGDLKEVPDPLLNGKTPRHAMQTLGTEWGRDCIHEDFWVDAWKRRVAQSPQSVICEDIRFDNEADAVKEIGGQVYHVIAKNNRRKTSTHVSEGGVSSSKITGCILNTSTIPDLHSEVREVVLSEATETFAPY